MYINNNRITIDNEHGPALKLVVNGAVKELPEGEVLEVKLQEEVDA